MVFGRNSRRPALPSRDSIETTASAQDYAALPAPSVISVDGTSSSPVSTRSTRAGSQAPSPLLLPTRPFRLPQSRTPVPPPAGLISYRPPPQSVAPSGSWTPQAPSGIMPYPLPPQFQPQTRTQQPQMPMQQSQVIMPYPYGPPSGQYSPPMGITPWAPPQYPQMGYPPPFGQPYPGYPPYQYLPPPPAQEPPAPPPHVKLQQDFDVARVSTAGMPSGSVDAPGNTPRLVKKGNDLRVVQPLWTEEDDKRFQLSPPVELPERVENLMKMQPNQTHYNTLGVHPNAPPDVLEAVAYAQLEVLQRKMDSPQSDTRMKALARSAYTNIVRAYEVLSDPPQREQYDEDIGILPAPSDQDHDLDESYHQAQQSATAQPEIILPSGKRCWRLEMDPWQVLEVPEDATEREIVEAYNAFHDKFLSNRHDLSDVELKAAQALLAEKRQAHDFLLDLDSDGDDGPEDQHNDRQPGTYGHTRHPHSSTTGHRDQSPGHRSAPLKVQNRGYQDTYAVEEGRFADSDDDYSDLPSEHGSANHHQARCRTTRPNIPRPVPGPSTPPNSLPSSGFHRNKTGSSLHQRVVTREHRDQGGRTDGDQALERQIRNRAANSTNEDDDFPSERHEDRELESDPRDTSGARSGHRRPTHAQAIRPSISRASSSRYS